MKTKELFETSLLPLNALAIQLGRFFAELSKNINKACLEKDTGCITQADACFDTEAPTLEFVVDFQASPALKPPSFQALAKKLLKDMKLINLSIDRYSLTRARPRGAISVTEWRYTFMIELGHHLGEMEDEEFFAFLDKMTDAFKNSIGDVPYSINC